MPPPPGGVRAVVVGVGGATPAGVGVWLFVVEDIDDPVLVAGDGDFRAGLDVHPADTHLWLESRGGFETDDTA